MGVTFGGKECLDPVALWEDARSVQPVLPTWNWWGKVNSFRCPAGPEAGKGWVLLHRGDLDALNLNTTHDLVLQYHRTVTLKNLLVLHAECITPRELDARQPAYVVEVADKRHLIKAFSPLIDRAYNVRSSPGSTSFLSATLNGGTEWTWTTLTTDLWNTVGTSRLGTYPGLPFSPHGNPEGWEFFQTSAYDALNQVLDRLCCTLTLNPFTGVFGIARAGSTDAALAAALLKWDAERIWDDDPEEPNQARLPQYVRVLFRRQPEPADGSSPWYAVDIADTSPAAGFHAGGYVSVHDDLAALGSSGTPTNSATLAARAAERAADWFRATREGWSRLRKVYRDVLPESGFAPGSQLTGLAHEDRGAGYKTEIVRGGSFRDLARSYPADGAQLHCEDCVSYCIDCDVTIDIMIGIEGVTYYVFNSVTGSVAQYTWLCFDGYWCGWWDLCSCEWIPWYCVQGACVQRLNPPPGATGPYATPRECHCGSGSGSGSGSEGTVQTQCCNNLLPATLTVLVSNRTGSCTCLPDSFEITNQVGFAIWGANDVAAPGCLTRFSPRLQCNPGGTSWSWSTVPNPGECAWVATQTSWTCPSFTIVFPNVTVSGHGGSGCCTGTATFTIVG